jgi:predicted metal-dependent hydrolase
MDIPVRRRDFPFGPDVPRAWFGGSPLSTALANGMNLVFPAGERFFIRSVRSYQDRIDDPGLRERVAGFSGQEAQHQRAHLAAFKMLEAQGYEVESWLRWYERMGYEVIEPRTSPAFRLATTAALEHLTATFGELALDSEMLDRVHPTMRDLLRWHAAEEIEHRDVAFDVFQAVDGRWIVRVGVFLMAVTVLGAFWASGTRHLLRQDPPAKRSDRRVERTELRAFWRRNGPRFAKNVLSYLKPGFHPRQMETDHLAEGYFADSALA